MRQTKLIFLIALIIAVLFIAQVILLSILIPKLNNQNDNNLSQSSLDLNAGKLVLTLSEVAKHNTPDNCWMVIGDKVYDIDNCMG